MNRTDDPPCKITNDTGKSYLFIYLQLFNSSVNYDLIPLELLIYIRYCIIGTPSSQRKQAKW